MNRPSVRSNSVSESTFTGLLADRRLLLTLFIALRFILIMTYMPLFRDGIERGMSAGGDAMYYFQLAGLSGQGYLPFRDWWSEFPPIPSFLLSGIYLLLGANANYTAFAMLFGLIMLGFDVGNLLLIRSIGTRLHGAITGAALAWVYAVLAAPLIFVWWNFEPMVAFFLLLGLWALLNAREGRAAIWATVGALVKFTPAIILGAVWRFRPVNRAVRMTLIMGLIFGGVYAVLFAQNAAMTAPSLTAQFNKASYESVWALIDGNYRTGNFGAAQERLDPANAYVIQGNPSRIPGILRLGAAALIGLFIYARTRRFDDKGLVAFITISLLIFFLQAQGWSPQWLAQIIPLLLLCFPTRDGITGIIVLTLVTFTEYPFLFIRTGDTGGTITGSLVPVYTMLILARTLILVVYCFALYRRLRQEPIPS